MRTFSAAQRKELAAKIPSELSASPRRERRQFPEKYAVPKGYDERYDHFVNFFKAIRERRPVYEDAVFGYRAAAPALLCNESLRIGRMLGWNPEAMKVV